MLCQHSLHSAHMLTRSIAIPAMTAAASVLGSLGEVRGAWHSTAAACGTPSVEQTAAADMKPAIESRSRIFRPLASFCRASQLLSGLQSKSKVLESAMRPPQHRYFRSGAALLQNASNAMLATDALDLDLAGEPERAEQLLRAGIETAIKAQQAGKKVDENQLCSLYDTLAKLLLKHGREQEAVDPAFKALEVRQAAEGDKGKNAALAALTYGMTLLANSRAQDAAPLFSHAVYVLSRLPAEEQPPVQLAEAKLYRSLAELAASPMANDDIEEHERGMLQAVRLLQEHLSAPPPSDDEPESVWAAWREAQQLFPEEVYRMLAAYRRVVAGVVSAGDLPTAVALSQQEIRLIRSYDPDGESMPVLLMACGYAMEASKLMFVLEQDEEAAALLDDYLRPALEQARFKDQWKLLLAKMRLGLAYGAMGLHGPALEHLHDVRPEVQDLLRALGDRDNPAIHEVDLMLALIKYQRLVEEDPAAAGSEEAARLVDKMKASLAKLEEEFAPAMVPVLHRYRGLVQATTGQAK